MTGTAAIDRASSALVRVGSHGLSQVLASAVLLFVMLNQRYGYSAGFHDHLVLSPLGMQHASPDLFKNDWTVANVPQPHWSFDLITWVGEATSSLALVYFLYFALAMLAFGAATTLLARSWAPQRSLLAVIAVTAISGMAPLYLLGSGGIFWPVALPNVLAAFLLYLAIAALLVHRHTIAAVTAVAVAIVHVQQGAMAAVVLIMMAIAVFLRNRRVDWSITLGAIGALSATVFGLKQRAIAGNISDFAKICDEIIPFHCNANAWRSDEIISGIAMVTLALLTVFYLARKQWYRWVVLLALPALGLLGGLFVDLLDVPVLGVLAQGVNIYRLAVLFLPFVAWGIVMPIFAQLEDRRRWTMLAVVAGIWFCSLRRLGTWGLVAQGEIRNWHWLLLISMAFVMACLAVTANSAVRNHSRTFNAALILVTFACLTSGYTGRQSTYIHAIQPAMHMDADPQLSRWGADIRRQVPTGELIVLPPTMVEARMATERPVIADCKYGPYGGDPYREYMSRLDDLGGLEQCQLNDRFAYDRMTATQIMAVANKYGASYVGLSALQSEQAFEFYLQGWELVVPSTSYVLIAIWKAPAA